MIEIIYSENKEEKTAGFPVKLPRNFRQIGSGEDYRKVYIEDYVMTYIRKLWEQGEQEYQVGVLMGSCKKYGGETYLFISGAVKVEEMEQEGNNLKFTDKVWTNLYEKIKQYFNSFEIVGWFYARNDSVREIDAGLFKTHVDNFGGMDKVLFLIDKKEKEEEFYAYENGQLARLSGYYVYYEKNEQMQEYMVEQAPNESVDERNDDRVTSNYRLLVQEKQDTHTKKKLSSALYTACTCLVIAILAAGTVLVRDYDRMQQLESQVHQIAVSVLGQNTETVKVEQVNGEVYPTETKETEVVIDTISESETQTKEIVTSEIVTSEIATTITESTSAVEEKDPEPDTTLGTQDSNGQAGYYYTVKKGETLTSICVAIYQSDLMVPTIKEANGIEDGDKIYPGQEIYLP